MNKHVKNSFKKVVPFLLFYLITLSVWAQQTSINGTVVDQQGQPIIGVSISVKGTSTGTISNVEGKFSLNAPPTTILQFTYLGMQTQEVPVAGKTSLTVVMKDASQDLDEVVVVGYGTQKKKDLTTSVSSVSSKDFANRPIVSAQQALQGKAAGVQVMQPSGKPGAGLSVRVRGATSINAGNDPLYVVDGVPTNDISGVAPTDIESMQILKDASSAAIYGSRAANGVVIITTKKGAKGESKINVSTYVGVSNVSKHLETLNTEQFYDLMGEIKGADNVDRSNKHYTDWADEMYTTAFQQNYQVSFSGGNEKTNYYVSGGYQNEEGVIKPSEYSRYSLRSNINSQVKDWLKITTNLNLAKTGQHNIKDNANLERGGVVLSILNTPPFMEKWDKIHPEWYYRNPYIGTWENPYANTDHYDYNDDNRFMGNFELDFTLAKGLHFKPSISMDYISHNREYFIDPIKTVGGRQDNGLAENNADRYMTWINENILSYNTRINENHNLTVMAGATFQRYNEKTSTLTGADFFKGTNLSPMPISMANRTTATTASEANSLASFLGRVQYDYKSRYLFTANFRTDGSSKLHPDHRWATFPSLSAGWRFSDEKFFASLTNVVNDAKLRAGWGRNGSQNGIGNYDYLRKVDIVRSAEVVGAGNNGPGMNWGVYGNKDLTWEITTQLNAGLDLTLFDSRLAVEFDVYRKKTTGLLLYINLPSSVPNKLPMRNDGEVTNNGFEYNLTGKILTGAFKWNANLNMSFNTNKVEKLGITPFFMTGNVEKHGDVIRIQEGLPLGTFWGYVADGVNPETGDMIYRDLNNDGFVDPVNDMTQIGSANPDFTFGFTNTFSWKNFSLEAFIQGGVGNDIYNAGRYNLENMTEEKNQSTAVIDRWTKPGMITSIPRAGVYDNSLVSSRFVEDGSYVRLKSLTLSYTLDSKLLSALKIDGLSIYGTANNLLTLTKYKGYDPELSWVDENSPAMVGIDMGTYPQTRSFIFGLNLTF